MYRTIKVKSKNDRFNNTTHGHTGIVGQEKIRFEELFFF